MEFWSDAPKVLQRFACYLDAFNWTAVEALCAEFVARLDRAPEPFPELFAKEILACLRRKRQFRSMEQIADGLLRNRLTSPQIYRQYAQSMIDQGNFTAATMVLDSVSADSKASAEERAEAEGLLGRIGKQLYVNAGNDSSPRRQANLRSAINRYYDVYRTNPDKFYWQGVNVIALLYRASADGIRVELPETKSSILSHISSLLAKDGLNGWERATAIEVALAADDARRAIQQAYLFASETGVNAFEIASLLRQLVEVWRLEESADPGATLLPLLRSALLRREGGALKILATDISASVNQVRQAQQGLEKVFGQDRYQPLEWMKTALVRCSAVARIESVTGQKIGTGFLVNAQQFFPTRDEKELLLLTNAHVISPANEPYDGAIPPEAAIAVFEESGRKFALDKLVWSSGPGFLDATFANLVGIQGDPPACPLTPTPAPFDRSKPKRLYAIGYPLGGGLSFSLQDSVWLDADDRVLHYRTPTEPGSSGSPVFDQDYWAVIGLHHKGRKDMPRLNGETGTYEANEAISIAAIRNATRAASNVS